MGGGVGIELEVDLRNEREGKVEWGRREDTLGYALGGGKEKWEIERGLLWSGVDGPDVTVRGDEGSVEREVGKGGISWCQDQEKDVGNGNCGCERVKDGVKVRERVGRGQEGETIVKSVGG